MKRFGYKNEMRFLLGLAVFVSIVHVWHPVTLSPTDSGDRTSFMFAVMLLAWAAKAGYSFGRIGIGVSFAFAATINSLIGLAYGWSMNSGNLLELIFWTLVLGISGLAFLIRKEIRVFEIERAAGNLSNQQI